MASGGMDWAYRMMASHKLDALGALIVMHLGWRDHPNFRSDRAMAEALGFDRASVRRASAKLAAMGIIERRAGGQWVACETVAIVLGAPGAVVPDRPDPVDKQGASSPRGPQAPGGLKPPGGGGLKPPQKGASSPPLREREIREAAPRGFPVARAVPGPGFSLDRARIAAEAGLRWYDPEGVSHPASAFAAFASRFVSESGQVEGLRDGGRA